MQIAEDVVFGRPRAVGAFLNATAGITALLAFATALLLPALFSGYPLIFWDSAIYVIDGFGSGEPHEKALPYAAFVVLTSLGRSLWPVIASQVLLTTYALYCTCLSHGLRTTTLAAVFGMVALIVLTPMAWTTSHVMPDIFAATLVLCMYVLLFRAEVLPRRHRVGMALLLALSASVHNSHLVLLTLLLLALLMVHAVPRWRRGWAAVPCRHLAQVAVLWVAATTSMIGMNMARTGEFYLFKHGHIYQLNRLIEDGLLQRLLADRCGAQAYLLCPYQPLTTDRLQFIIDPDSPLYRTKAYRPESRDAVVEMIVDTIRYYPLSYVGASVAQVWEQLRSFDLVRYVFRMVPEPRKNPDHFGTQAAEVLLTLQSQFPAEYPQFVGSRQQHDTMPGHEIADNLAEVHAVSAWFAAGIAAGLALWGPQGARRDLRRMAGFFALALLLNATVCAVLSHSEFRYQARVIWLLPLAAWVAVMCARRSSTNDLIGDQ